LPQPSVAAATTAQPPSQCQSREAGAHLIAGTATPVTERPKTSETAMKTLFFRTKRPTRP
jgi:hypothetical protein